MDRIGIMGGTFDPIHLGHLAAAEAARSNYQLDTVLFIPAGVPPHKSGTISSSQHRLAMVKLATENTEYFAVSDFEINRPGKSYTIDTVRALRDSLGTTSEFFFITGADAILEIFTWHKVEELIRFCTFIAVTRPGYAQQGLEQELDSLPANIRARIKVLEVQGLNISSTQIRNLIKNNEEITGLVPDRVKHYIIKHRLYK